MTCSPCGQHDVMLLTIHALQRTNVRRTLGIKLFIAEI